MILRGVKLYWVNLMRPNGLGDRYACYAAIPKNRRGNLRKIMKEIRLASEFNVPDHMSHEQFMALFHGSLPLKDGDIMFDVKPTSERAGFRDCWVLRATNINRPAVIDEYGEPIEFEVHEGCEAAINVKFRPYTFNGSCGVCCIVDDVMIMGSRDQLTIVDRAREVFKDLIKH